MRIFRPDSFREYHGHTIAIARSELDGDPAWKYTLRDERGRVCGVGWYAGARELAVRAARRAVDNRLAERAQQGAN